MDIDMPIKNGISTTIELRKLNCNSNILAITAYSQIENKYSSIF